jgi:tRNA(Phe) wybutosine-synthesizing methylase Tyw3
MLKFNKKYDYDNYMDPEVLDLCNAMNALPGIKTFESCYGHGRTAFHIWFRVK